MRALAWTHEVPFWLLSGSWDGSIRVWDTRTGECLRVRAPAAQRGRCRTKEGLWHGWLDGRSTRGKRKVVLTELDVTVRASNWQLGARTVARHLEHWSILVNVCVSVCVYVNIVYVNIARASSQTVLDHYADVYGLDSHPSRPFVFASSSRDTTMRFWTLHGDVDLLKVRQTSCAMP